MSKNNPHYLLVDVGEIIQAGDQIRTEYPTSWRKVGTVLIGEPVLGGNVVRRPLRFNPEAVPLMVEALEHVLKHEGNPKPNPGCHCQNCKMLNPVHAALAAAKGRGAE